MGLHSSIITGAVAFTVLLGATEAPVPTPVPVPPSPTFTPAVPMGCPRIVFLGARGSGESLDEKTTGMGGPVYAAYLVLKNSDAGRDVAPMTVVYPAERVDVLVWDLFAPQSKKLFYAGVSEGATATVKAIADRATECKDERFVVAGYSQGAMVIRRAMQKLAASSATRDRELSDRIMGVLLLADPDITRDQGGYQTSTGPGLGQGVSWTALGEAAERSAGVALAKHAAIPPTLADHWYSVCDLGDAVCDTDDLIHELSVLTVVLPLALGGWAFSPLGIGLVDAGVHIHVTHYGKESPGVKSAVEELAGQLAGKHPGKSASPGATTPVPTPAPVPGGSPTETPAPSPSESPSSSDRLPEKPSPRTPPTSSNTPPTSPGHPTPGTTASPGTTPPRVTSPAGAPPRPPSDVHTNQLTGALEWRDNSGDEQGFHVYISGILVATEPANSTMLHKSTVGDCSDPVVVGAFNQYGESRSAPVAYCYSHY